MMQGWLRLCPVHLGTSDGPSPSGNTESWPGHMGPELGEMLYLPILSDIGGDDLKGHLLDFGDAADPYDFVGRIFPGRAHRIRKSEIH